MLFRILCLLSLSSLFAKEPFLEPWGKDTQLLEQPKMQEASLSLVTRIADTVIRFHQDVLSKVDGPRSHFRPTSSRYMQLAMHRYGFVKGFLMGCDRLLREDDEEWIYPVVYIDGQPFKYDPAWNDKYHYAR